MALQLMKLQVIATTTVEANPQPQKFFYVTTADTAAGTTLTIDAADFFDDSGVAVVSLPELAANNSMYSVSVNGVPQMEGITIYTPGATAVGSLVINVPAGGDSILAGSPVVLEIINYVPSSTVDINT